MYLGIDVGGTFTDAVAVEEGQIAARAKTPTTHDNLLQGILTAIDSVLGHIPAGSIKRVSLSTTVVTNTLIEGKTDKVALIIVPGPGLDIEPLLPAKAFVLSGYTDHRGREAALLNTRELTALLNGPLAEDRVFAVSGKFAVRNPEQETQIAREIAKRQGVCQVSKGSSVAGSLNFLRRTNSAYFNAAVWRKFQQFARAVEGALAARAIAAPLYILKADGGTMPLAFAKERPVEAIFTGPAASVMGIMALHRPTGDTISLDIGGTTTDIALWHNGIPLFASQGALAGTYPTAVRAFWLHSVGIGGDSVVLRENNQLSVGPERLGPAMALGGSQPALADALIVSGCCQFGSIERAYEAMKRLTLSGRTPEETAAEVVHMATVKIQKAIHAMLAAYQTQPVYTVEDMIHIQEYNPAVLVGVGGTAPALAPAVARLLDVECIVPRDAALANALGAALACPTTDITVRADTEQGFLTVPELGIKEKLPHNHMGLADVRQLAAQYLTSRSQQSGIPIRDIETVYEEEFRLVRGFHTAGKIITCRQQIKPGVMAYIHED